MMPKTLDANALSFVFLAAFMFLTAPLAQSTTLAQLSLAQLVDSTHAIVHAQAISNMTVWHDGEIWTVTTFRILENWKGHVAPKIEVWMIGGRAGRITSYVPGAPRFRPGEEAVLFLEPMRDGEISITAWGEGTFRIHRDVRTGESRVTQDTAIVPEFVGPTHPQPRTSIRDWPLEEFKTRVLQAKAATRGVR